MQIPVKDEAHQSHSIDQKGTTARSGRSTLSLECYHAFRNSCGQCGDKQMKFHMENKENEKGMNMLLENDHGEKTLRYKDQFHHHERRRG